MLDSERTSFEEKLANQLIDTIAKKNNLTHIESVKAKYGLSILFINVFKVGLIYTVSMIIGVVTETIYMHLSFCIFRKFSFGFHFQKNLICSIVSVILFSIVPFLIKSQTIKVNTNICLLIGVLSMIISFFKVPAVSRPVSNPKFKRNVCLAIIAFCFFILDHNIAFSYSRYIRAGLSISNVLLLPKIGGPSNE